VDELEPLLGKSSGSMALIDNPIISASRVNKVA
jgi:hypothetical protein